VGKIVHANGGTLFLDEIGDMPLSLQAHLLRVLQERQVTPLGSAKAVSVDVMLVCATHRNLREMIEQKSFREDLYYRLNGLAVRLPPLRERTDLMALVERILERESPDRRLRLSPDVLRLFQGYQWPGNVRQLFNVLRTASVMASGDTTITRDHLSDDFIDDARHASVQRPVLQAAAPEPELLAQRPATADASVAAAAPVAPVFPAHEQAGRSLEDIELQSIQRAVDAAGGNISVAAKQLGISRNTIYRKLRWKSPR
jgi:sigma-54 dependent transcriptional regulator, acetoin dehydrogenase operon transcriptional activator AcoR